MNGINFEFDDTSVEVISDVPDDARIIPLGGLPADYCLPCEHLHCVEIQQFYQCNIKIKNNWKEWPCAFNENGVAMACVLRVIVDLGTSE